MNKKPIQIKIEISKRIFCFYALLNVLGYNPEIFPVNPLRKGVRILLKNTLIKSKYSSTVIKNLIKQPDISKEFWFPLRNWVLCHDQPPTFKELSPYWKNFLDTQTGKEFDQELKRFWKIGQLDYIWKIVKNDYLKIKKQCHYNAKIAVKSSLDYLCIKNKEIDFKKFIVIPNLLDEYNRGIGPKINDTTYAILGPSKGNDMFPIQRIEHEFLHSLINPITKEVFNNKIPKSQLSLIRETLIHSMVLHINKSNRQYYQKKLKRLKKSRYKDIEKVIVFLEKYKNQQDNFKNFLVKNNIWN